MDPAPPLLVDATARVTAVICAAILMSIPIYVVMAWVIVGQGGAAPAGGGLPSVVTWALAAVGAALLAAGQALWAALRRSAASRPTLEERLATYRTATVVSFAVRESAAIVGLAITLLTGDLRWCLVLGAAAVLAMLLGWPRRADIARLAADPAAAPIG